MAQKHIILILLVMVVVMVMIYMAAVKQNQNVAEQKISNASATTTSQYVQKASPGNFPSVTCPLPSYQRHSVILNSSGFRVFNISRTKDYVIQPGKNGSMQYEVYLAGTSGGRANITNWVQFYHIADQNNTVNSHAGINVSIYPEQESLSGKNYTVTVNTRVSKQAVQGTYLVIYSPGVCSGGPAFLLTVGASQYNGINLSYNEVA